VDAFEPGKTLPCCQLLAQLRDHQTEDVPEVDCRIHLCGAKSPRNYFKINLPRTGKTIINDSQSPHANFHFEKALEWRGNEAGIIILLCIVKLYNVMYNIMH
jgi:hypothetical protein